MARGTQLTDLIDMVRAETGQSLSRAHGVNSIESLKATIRRVQDWLYHDFEWPWKRLYVDKQLAADVELYDWPTEFDMSRAFDFWVHTDGRDLYPMTFSIGPHEIRSVGGTHRGRPLFWDYADTQFRVLPIPDAAWKARIWGIKKLNAMTAESDTADLDDNLIVLFAAAEILQRQQNQDANTKMQAAERHYTRLKAIYSSNKHRNFSLLGGPRRVLRPGIDYIA